MSVTKNTTLKIKRPFSTPATIGYVAKIMGTAPRRPTHDTYSRALVVNRLNGASDTITAKGRATSIKNAPTAQPKIKEHYNLSQPSKSIEKAN